MTEYARVKSRYKMVNGKKVLVRGHLRMKHKPKPKNHICPVNIPKLGFWLIKNRRGSHLGKVYWFPDWKCWVWEQFDCTIMSEGCLRELIEFMGRLPTA